MEESTIWLVYFHLATQFDPANVSALRKSLKIIKDLMSLIEMCSAAEVRREVDGLLVRNVAR